MTVGQSVEGEPEVTVRNNVSGGQYELILDGSVIGLATYSVEGSVATFPHFEIDPAHRGGGMAGRLARFALDDVRAHGQTVMPLCPFLVRYLQRHPQDQDLLAPGVSL